MPNKMSRKAAACFMARQPMASGSTAVTDRELILYGRILARHGKEGIEIKDGGHPSRLTRDRLAAVVEAVGYTYKISFTGGKIVAGQGKEQVHVSGQWIALSRIAALLSGIEEEEAAPRKRATRAAGRIVRPPALS